MEKQTKISILPFVAHALALLPGSRDKINELFAAKKAVYWASALKNQDRNAPILVKGRAEHYVIGMRALGIISYALNIGDEITMRRLLRSANASAFDTLYSIRKTPTNEQVRDWIGAKLEFATDSEVTWRMFVVWFDCAYLGIEQNSLLLKGISDFVQGSMDDRVNPLPPEAIQTARARDMIKRFSNIDANTLYGPIADEMLDDEGRLRLEALFTAADLSGLDIADYASGVTLTKAELAECLLGDDPGREIERAVMMCVCKAARIDREFCMTLAREDKTLDIEAANAERDKAIERAGALGKRCAALEAELINMSDKTAVKELDKVLDDIEVLRRENASLRSALFETATSQYGEADVVQTHHREIPKGIVSVGGHPDWIRKMKEYVPDGHFYSADVSVPSDVVRNAPEVWVQPLYIGHWSYEPVVDEARRANVPVKYFPSTGAERCFETMQEE